MTSVYTQSENTYRFFNNKYKESIIILEEKYAHMITDIYQLQLENRDLKARIRVLEWSKGSEINE
tara:strand:- start:639 stop:833 length:195 start_codon:yes stop_codon:yes gene_type:complete